MQVIKVLKAIEVINVFKNLYYFYNLYYLYYFLYRMSNLQISDNAAKRILKLKNGEPENSRLRIIVEGGGCNGFQYKFDFDVSKADDDQIFTNNGAEVILDGSSAELMNGSILDYIETLGYSHFEIKNPQAQSSCGCGNSFSV